MTRIRTLIHYTNPPALAGGCSVCVFRAFRGSTEVLGLSLLSEERC
jgi:hypothetical protein